MANYEYPKTKSIPVSENIHGRTIVDNYRWLENGEDDEVKNWVKEQNKFTQDTLEQNGSPELFREELAEIYKDGGFSALTPRNGMYFWSERKPGEDQTCAYYKKGIDGKEIKILDPNGLDKDNTVSLDYWRISQKNTYVAYGMSQGGSEMATIKVRKLETLKDEPDTIPYARHSSIAWLSDESGFYYTKNLAPELVPKGEGHMHTKVYFHKLGDDPKNDEMIFGQDRPKDDIIGISFSADDQWLVISATQEWTKNDLAVYNTKTKKLSWLVQGIDALFGISFAKNRVFLRTNYKADNFRILSCSYEDILKNIDEWEEVVAEREYLLEFFSITEDKLIGMYSVNAVSKGIIFDYFGNELGELPIPPLSSIAGIGHRREEKEFFYNITNYVTSSVMYRYDPILNSFSVHRTAPNPLNPDDYETKQEWYESKDGTKMPMFIVHKKDLVLDGNSPTLMYGYGGFGNIQGPGFPKNSVPWIKRGGVFVSTNIRGGGEYGEKWHEAGILDKKQNSYDDFIAAAEYLIDKKYTNPNKLAIMGGSNGGLLVGAVMIQRPDLFSAVVSNVPLLDMIRFPLFGMAIRWVHEYGDPSKEKDFSWIEKWSPYQNVKQKVSYPAVFFMTAEKDSRVDPLHARKMTALMQSLNGENPVLLRTEIEAGHGSGKPVNKIIGERADILAFLFWQTGLKI